MLRPFLTKWAEDVPEQPDGLLLRTQFTETREHLDQTENTDGHGYDWPWKLGRTSKTATQESIDQSESSEILLARTRITMTREGVDASEVADDSIDPYYI